MHSVPVTVHKAIALFNHNDFHDNVCLLCLKISNNLSGLDELVHVDECDYTVKEVLKAVTFDECKLHTNTQLKICLECLTRASETFSFRLQYLRSQRALQALLKHKNRVYKKSTALIDLAPDTHNFEGKSSKEKNTKDESSNSKLLLYQCRCRKIFSKQEDYERHVGFACLSSSVNEKTKNSMESNIHRNNLIKSILYDQSENICCFCLDFDKEMVSLDKNIKVISGEPGVTNVEFNLRTALGDFVPLLVRENIVSSSVCTNCLNTVLPSVALLTVFEYTHLKVREVTSDLYEKVMNAEVLKRPNGTDSLVLFIDVLEEEADNQQTISSKAGDKDFEDEITVDSDIPELTSNADVKDEITVDIDIPNSASIADIGDEVNVDIDIPDLASNANIGDEINVDIDTDSAFNADIRDEINDDINIPDLASSADIGDEINDDINIPDLASSADIGDEIKDDIDISKLASNSDITDEINVKINFPTPGGWQCTICGENNEDVEALTSHLLQHSNEYHKCKFCGKRFQTETTLNSHSLKVHGLGSNYICYDCGKEFRAKITLVRHLQKFHLKSKCPHCSKNLKRLHLEQHNRNHRVKAFPCDICERSFCTQKLLSEHVFDTHSSTCKICKKTFHDKREFCLHARVLHKTIKCERCSKVITQHYYRRHLDLHIRYDVNKDFACDICGRSFHTEKLLNEHVFDMHSSTCKFCKKTFNDKRKFCFHAKYIHKTIKCKICDMFIALNRYKRHLDLHTGNHRVQAFVCDICNRSFCTQILLSDHVFDTHSSTCKICKKTFDDKRKFWLHSKYIHKKSVKCEKCSKFVTQYHYKQHLDQHMRRDASKAFSCNICDRSFYTQKLLNDHVLDTHSSNRNICKKTFDDKRKFWLHAKYTHKTIKCEKCSKVIAQDHYKQHLEQHMRHDVSKAFSCDVCDRSFYTQKLLKDHVLDTHSSTRNICKKTFNDKYHNCKFCVKSFRTETALNSHSRKVHGLGLKYICYDCGKDCRAKLTLVRHIQKFHSKSKCPHCSENVKRQYLEQHIRNYAVKAFPCYICDTSFCTQKLLSYHNFDTHSRTCTICNKTFDDKRKFFVHTKIVHKTIECRICSKVITKGYYKYHLDLHNGIKPSKINKKIKSKRITQSYDRNNLNLDNGIEPRTFICDICGIIRSGKYALEQHILSHSTKKCNICGKVLRLSYYKSHVRKHETQVRKRKSYFCEYCAKSFSHKSCLTGHVNKVHLKIRPYSCDQCGRCYATKPMLAVHRKSHLGLRPHQCSVCDMKLCNNQALIKHMRVHTGDKPYKCDHCDERFSSTNKKQEHTTQIHDMETFACKYCDSVFKSRNSWRGHTKKVHKISVSELRFYKTKLEDDDGSN